MPYIPQDRRKKFDEHIAKLANAVSQEQAEGELNYIITKLLKETYRIDDDLRYQKINNMMGVVESVKQELYRRWAAPYEDKKKQENGDV